MKTVKEVTTSQLIEEMLKFDGSQFVNIVTETEPRMRKTNNPYLGRVKKQTRQNYLLGSKYEQRVQNNEKKEGLDVQFKTESSRVGRHLSKVVLYNDKTNTHYLQLEPFTEIVPSEVTFFLDGNEVNEIDMILLQDFIQNSTESQKQVQDKKVFVKCPKFENILEMTMSDTIYKVVN